MPSHQLSAFLPSGWWLPVLLFACVVPAACQGQPEVLTLESPRAQTAVLDPVAWDTPIPNERYFDAVRPMLVRFPGISELIHARLTEGYQVDKVELVLDWDKQDGPRAERGRAGWGADELYRDRPGQWNVVARAVRHPWSVDVPALGPTFNAYINKIGYWNHGGARGDGADRSTWVAGPQALHPAPPAAAPAPADPGAEPGLGDPLPPKAKTLTARLDVTQAVTDPAQGKTLGERLRALDENGFQVHKWEIRDMNYRSFWAYDWSVSIAYMRIWVKQPRLVVTLRRQAQAAKVEPLPPAVDIAKRAEELKAKGGDGTPTIYYPDDMAERIAKHMQRPADIPDWEWQRISELRALGTDPRDVDLYLGRGYNFNSLFAGDRDAYLASMRELLRMPPRFWQGHQTSDFALLPYAYGDLLPPAVLDHLKLYWESWLHPEVEKRDNIGGGNQRGGPSYFRGYSHGGGTMNFGHNATMGALLGGQFLKAPFVTKDASEGVFNLSAGGFGLGTGAHQEIGDTYYQALTVNGTGAMAHYAEDPVNRLLMRFHRDRLLEPLISMYHPSLRRMTHPMGRGDYAYHILLQEGPYHVLHTLSPSGTLLHLDELNKERRGTPAAWGNKYGLSILGDEAPPFRVSLLAPWTEPYLSETMGAAIDGKTFPFRAWARDYSPGCRGGGWHVNYLAPNYALASRDNANHDYGITSVVAHWRRKTEQVSSVDDLTTFIMNFERNARFPAAGTNMAEFGIVQHDNKLIALKALPRRDVLEAGKESIIALQSCIAMLAFGDIAQREVWINDVKSDAVSGAKPNPGGDWRKRLTAAISLKADATPEDPEAEGNLATEEAKKEIVEITSPTRAMVEAKDGDVITIKDGVTYVGIIPVVVNPLERNRQVEISYEYPTLQINAFLYRNNKPLNLDRVYNAEKKPTAGFVVEMGDATQYPSFDAFRAHLKNVKLSVAWNAEKKLADVTYTSGNDLLEMGFDPARYPAVYRRINGQWPYLADGIMRESSWAIQGSMGRLEKLGAVLTSEPGHHAYLLAVPATDTYVGYNPLPDPMMWSLQTPGGVTVTANGKLSLARVTVNPKTAAIHVDYAARPNQTGPEMATALLVTGLQREPVVTLNDKPYPGKLLKTDVDGKPVYAIALTGK